MNPDPVKRVQRLKAYLLPIADSLEAKGVLHEYLAYAIEHLVQQQNK